jgi:hypothetical protein
MCVASHAKLETGTFGQERVRRLIDACHEASQVTA